MSESVALPSAGTCTPDEARDLTDRIKQTAESIWSLLLEAHERRAWMALGYESWERYVRTEFDMTRSYSYRVLDQGIVIRALGQATGSVSPIGDIPEWHARDIKPVLSEVTETVRDRIQSVPDATPEQRRQIVQDVINEHRTTPAPALGTRRYPKASASASLPSALASLGGIALAFRQVNATDVQDIDPQDAAQWARDLTDVIAALRGLRALLKEQAS